MRLSLLKASERDCMDKITRQAIDAHHDVKRNGIVAATIKDGTVICVTENAVNSHDDPTKHAEMVAYEAATNHLGTKNLSGCTLLSTLQPCEMCLAAMLFSGITRVIFGAEQQAVNGKYFSFPRLTIADFCRAARDPFDYVGGVNAEELLPLYAHGAE